MTVRGKIPLSVSRAQSVLTNGRHLLANVDHRTAWMRRLKDLVANHVSDLGGDDCISHSERMLVNRASMLVLQLEMLDSKFADNDGVGTREQVETYQRLTNTLRRCLETLGLPRRPRPVPSLSDYLEGRVNKDMEDAAATAE